MSTQTDIAIDPDRLNALLGQAVVEFGATVNAALVVIGDRLGLYRALAAEGPANAAELAQQTGTAGALRAEWLGAQAASGYVDYDADTDSYALSPEQAAAFADESSPAFVAGGFQVALGRERRPRAHPGRVSDRRRDGLARARQRRVRGLPTVLRTGISREPAERLDPGARRHPRPAAGGGRVADVGCGHGASADHQPRATRTREVTGFDYHEDSIAHARNAPSRPGWLTGCASK